MSEAVDLVRDCGVVLLLVSEWLFSEVPRASAYVEYVLVWVSGLIETAFVVVSGLKVTLRGGPRFQAFQDARDDAIVLGSNDVSSVRCVSADDGKILSYLLPRAVPPSSEVADACGMVRVTSKNRIDPFTSFVISGVGERNHHCLFFHVLVNLGKKMLAPKGRSQ